ncbi:MAG: hypothetical protein JSS86_05940 [Cyanobacteria bacterium SZAS LIN-2]|nr:hypothetical protein [Cyanobacteria bacterium SZAS LIN-3]MBS1995829.1 hypothetical protein [Cyanobacteria bacterium SZAS LIN-2]
MIYLIEHPILKFALGIVVIVLGLSFIWKGWQAMVLGRFYYWSGFLPATLISPWLIHLPPSKRSLVKQKEGMLAHMVLGPSFMLCSVLFICAGTDLLGLPGTKTLNVILNGGNQAAPTSVSFDENTGRYAFPIITKSWNKVYHNFFEAKVSEDHDLMGRPIEKMYEAPAKTIDGRQAPIQNGKEKVR